MMTTNLFDYFEDVAAGEPGGAAGDSGVAAGEPGATAGEPGRARWAVRAPRRPHERFDLVLVPRSPAWTQDPDALAALAQIEREPWVDFVARTGDGVRLRLDDGWVEAAGATLEAGGDAGATLTDLARGRRFSVQFWDANATKALHVGHLRNLAIGNALAAALTQAGGQVERRSLISDAGRSMGEAMAGVMQSGRHARSWPDGDEKSDHFVGVCYADYVAASGSFAGHEVEYPEDSLTRELSLRDDAADELLKRVLHGEREALELWYKTRAWVIAGQRKTLARLGVAFDRVFFESDFLAEAAELTESGLRDGRLQRRRDGAVVYATGLEDLEEFALMRADGLPTQHMRALVYWMAAPDLGQMTSMQVCGTEWVSHVACRRKLMDELMPSANGAVHPTHDIFHGMVSRQKRAVASSQEGALLIDDLTEWLDAQIESDPRVREVRHRHPSPERVAAQIMLGYFLPHPVAPQIDFDPSKLLRESESLGWDLVCARAHRGRAPSNGGRPADDPNYRFAVVQSEIYRRHLRLAMQRLDLVPLALYLRHLARWYLERDRDDRVERVVHTLLDRSARGLGLEAR
jgi:arginyl-tRNA synthetase